MTLQAVSNYTFTERTQRRLDGRNVSQEDQQGFAKILEKRMQSNMSDQAFLASLDKNELDHLKAVHKYVELNIYSLSEEGARNLFLPLGYEVDLNDDGLYEVGQGKMMALLPNDAPEALHSYLDSLTLKERMSFFVKISVQKLKANAYQKANGQWHIVRPDEPNYVNIFTEPGFSYTKLANLMLEDLEFQCKFMSSDKYYEDLYMLEKFKVAAGGY